MSMKCSNDTIGNRTRDLPACSTMPPRTQSVIPSVFTDSCVIRTKERWYTQDNDLVKCDAVYVSKPTFRRKLLPSSPG
jgi:hypothetical protein